MTTYVTHSAEETIELGRKISTTVLKVPMLVLLRGDLGAGKTTMVKGIAEAFGAAEQDKVTSPTFTLIHEYRAKQVSIYHVDLYRIDTQRELETLGLEEILNDPKNLVLIEWGEKFPSLVQQRDAEIAIDRVGSEDRKVVIS